MDVTDDARQTAATDGRARLARLMDGYLTTQLLYVAAKLGVADALAAGPRSGAAIGRAVGADVDAMTRILRGLVVEEVLTEDDDGLFALTPLGTAMRAGVAGSLRGPIIVRGEMYQQAATGMLDAVRHGGTAFEHVYGERFFEHLDHHAGHEAAFQGSMAGRAENEAADVVAAYDFGALDSIVDVGGGEGVLLEAVVRATARLSATLVDRPDVVARARDRLTAAGLAHRCRFVVGDFFTSIPPGAEAYLLSRVLHDWDDVDAGRILATCRTAMTGHSRLLIVEAILPRRASEQPAAIRMDLHMMMLLGARERTEQAFRQLLSDAGFAVRRVTMTSSPVGLAVIEAHRTPDAARW
jgi:hypothetical protein